MRSTVDVDHIFAAMDGLGCPEDAPYFPMSVELIEAMAFISSLAELKVLLYVARHTWGYREYDTPKHITVDEFMHGRKRADGSRIDYGTGLSEQAVRDGLKGAIRHGLIVCAVDDSDAGRVEKCYAIKRHCARETQLAQEDTGSNGEQDTQEIEPHNAAPGVQDLDLDQRKNLEEKDFLSMGGIRKGTSINDTQGDEPSPLHPCKGGSHKAPAFIRRVTVGFSRDCGDPGHVSSNITRAYRLYEASGLSQQAFIALLYEARAAARRASIKKVGRTGWPNRMPYLFAVVSRAIAPINAPEQV